jgi:hypothetical protein
MRAFVNEDLVQSRARLAQRALLAGVMIFAASAVLSFNPRHLLLAYGLIVPGVLIAIWGLRAGERWLQKPRVDELLDKALKGLGNAYRLYSYILPAEHILLAPDGLYVLIVKRQGGRIICRGEKCSRPFSVARLPQVLGEERLGRPIPKARKEAQRLHRWLAGLSPDLDAPVRPVVVFAKPQVALEVDTPAVPTMLLADLKAYVRDAARGHDLPRKTLQELAKILDERLP